MLFFKYLLIAVGVGLFGGASGIAAYDIFIAAQLRRLLNRDALTEGCEPGGKPERPLAPIRWRLAQHLAVLGIAPFLLGLSIVVVPDGSGGVRVSQISGTRPGTLYPGVHLVVPLVDRVALYDLREHLFSTAAGEGIKKESHGKKTEVLRVQAREGLSVGVAVAVRYHLDPRRLSTIHGTLAQPIDEEIVAPVVATIFRQVAPNYLVRELFAARREEIRQKAADAIIARLGADGIIVKEVSLRDIELPVEYARGLEGLLLKEQESERLGTETDIKEKQVRIAELEAEAQKKREVKQAEAAAAVRVLQAKAESDAMQYTLPLKEKQIEQSKLEAAARKEATLQNADAAAKAKVIDSKAERERQNLLSDAEANRIRVTAAADSERLKLEASVLKQNPMLIQKIIAERLSDKLQIMMVPIDGKNFFANDVLRSAFSAQPGNTNDAHIEASSDDVDGPPVPTTAQRQGNRKH
ncbi:MAG TPA: SPFH domain-containing protein [Candidatus Dormibacteraeota bacterium]|nr:SPFH domain-containing protein [Candidatus Dormibacteraeota bacterium]